MALTVVITGGGGVVGGGGVSGGALEGGGGGISNCEGGAETGRFGLASPTGRSST